MVSLPSAADDIAIEPGRAEKVYPPLGSKLWRSGLIGIGFGVVVGGLAAPRLFTWAHGGTIPGPRDLLMGAGGGLFFIVGVLAIIGALRGLPRLTLTTAGVKLQALWGTTWAEWASLSAFTVTAIHSGNRLSKRTIKSASADVTGTAVSENLRRRKKLSIPDLFAVPITEIAADLNAQHAHVVGISADALPAPATQKDDSDFGIAGFRVPWLTLGILIVLVAVFVAEIYLGVGAPSGSMRPNVTTLLALGGENRVAIVTNGEWYRLFTSPFLHVDIGHLALNGLALLMAGYSLERIVGRAWFLAFFVLGALGGDLMSLAISPDNVTSVGASGAIMGLFAAAMTSSFRLPSGTPMRSRIQARSIQILVPSLLPLATSSSGNHIDYGAHIGGALVCGLATVFLIKTWPDTDRLPAFRTVAAGIAVAGMLLVGVGAVMVASHYPKYRIVASLIPQGSLPRTTEDIRMRATDLAARYPQDPRSHMYLAINLEENKNYTEAERELRTGIQQAENLRFFIGAQLPNVMRVLLAGVLLDANKPQEAKEAARPVCQAPLDATDNLRKTLTSQHLCD